MLSHRASRLAGHRLGISPSPSPASSSHPQHTRSRTPTLTPTAATHKHAHSLSVPHTPTASSASSSSHPSTPRHRPSVSQSAPSTERKKNLRKKEELELAKALAPLSATYAAGGDKKHVVDKVKGKHKDETDESVARKSKSTRRKHHEDTCENEEKEKHKGTEKEKRRKKKREEEEEEREWEERLRQELNKKLDAILEDAMTGKMEKEDRERFLERVRRRKEKHDDADVKAVTDRKPICNRVFVCFRWFPKPAATSSIALVCMHMFWFCCCVATISSFVLHSSS